MKNHTIKSKKFNKKLYGIFRTTMKKRVNKQNAIDMILVELQKGSTYSDCLSVFCGKFRLSDRTFDKYWKEANEAYNKTREEIKEQLRGEVLEAEKERLKKAILTKDERLVEASKIARGEGRKVHGQILIPSDGDRLRALDYLSRVDGDYAVIKQEFTGKDGQALFPARTLTKEEARELMEGLENDY